MFADAQTKILFVGNSLTYTNNLPLLVEKIAKEDGTSIVTEMIAFPNYALEDHWNETQVSSALARTKYDYVILQQGPSAMPASRTNLVEYALKFSQLCRKSKAKVCLYTVWPSRERNFDFLNVIKSYAMAADTAGGRALEAGLAWKKILDENEDFPLYSSDDFHPTMHGSLLSAMVIYATLFQKNNFDFLKLENLSSKSITEAELDLMKNVALGVSNN